MENINAVHKAHAGQVYAKPNTSQKRLDAAAKATATKRAKRDARWATAKAAQCLQECEIVAVKYPPFHHEPGCPKETPHETYAQAIESQDFSGYERVPSEASIRARKLAETADPANARKLLALADGLETVRGVVAAHFPKHVSR